MDGAPHYFFEPLDDTSAGASDGDETTERFRATVRTQGPWDAGAQHGGPPAALLGRAVERCRPPATAMVARITCEILGPVPVDEVEVTARVVRPGRSVELVEAVLTARGRAAVRASAWRIRTTDTGLDHISYGTPPPLPEVAAEMPPPGWRDGYLSAMEWRYAQGRLGEPGPGTVWVRPRVPLVRGEDTTPLQRLLLVADSGNGVSGPLDVTRYWFINPELTVHVHRQPVGEWTCLEARTSVQPHGVGLAESTLYDERGPVGRGAQALFIGPRPPATG